MHALTGFQRDVRSIIAGMGAPNTLAIKEPLDHYSPRQIDHGKLSPNLDALVEMALVEKGGIDERTHSYSITEVGNDQLIERREWEEGTTGASN